MDRDIGEKWRSYVCPLISAVAEEVEDDEEEGLSLDLDEAEKEVEEDFLKWADEGMHLDIFYELVELEGEEVLHTSVDDVYNLHFAVGYLNAVRDVTGLSIRAQMKKFLQPGWFYTTL